MGQERVDHNHAHNHATPPSTPNNINQSLNPHQSTTNPIQSNHQSQSLNQTHTHTIKPKKVLIKTYGRDMVHSGVYKLMWSVFLVMGGEGWEWWMWKMWMRDGEMG